MYDPISPNVNFVEQEKQIEKFQIFAKPIITNNKQFNPKTVQKVNNSCQKRVKTAYFCYKIFVALMKKCANDFAMWVK